MKEVIESIKDTHWDDRSPEKNERYAPSYEGLLIQTNKQLIKIAISSDQRCCEDVGSFSTNEEDLDYFTGAEIFGIKLTDESLNTKMIQEKFEYGFDGGGIQFVDIETSKGTIQYAVYNHHNGYYGHEIVIESEQLKHSGSL